MLFFTFDNTDIWFAELELIWKTHSTIKVLLTTQKVEIIYKKKFAIAVLNDDDKTFVVHMTAFSVGSNIYLFQYTQIVLLNIKQAINPTKYLNYSNVFSSDSATELHKYIGINDHSINLIDNKQLSYYLVYSLRLMELETLRTYIKINLANGFIKPSKLLTSAPIIFFHKKDDSFQLYVNYQDLNNLTIKNQYPLPLIGKSLNYLGYTKCFIHLNLTNVYHQIQIQESDK